MQELWSLIIPSCKHGSFAFWITIFVGPPVLSMLLANWTLVPPFSTLATFGTALMPLCLSPSISWFQQWWMHEETMQETMLRLRPLRLVWQSWNYLLICWFQHVNWEVGVHIILKILTSNRSDHSNCMIPRLSCNLPLPACTSSLLKVNSIHVS